MIKKASVSSTNKKKRTIRNSKKIQKTVQIRTKLKCSIILRNWMSARKKTLFVLETFLSDSGVMTLEPEEKNAVMALYLVLKQYLHSHVVSTVFWFPIFRINL